MNERIGSALARVGVTGLLAVGSLALAAGSASASEVLYNNFNTVPSMVNGHPNQDTFSAYVNYFPFGGQVEFPRSRDNVLKSLSVQLDSFACEEGEYQFENCYSPKENKKFKLQLSASLYKVGAGNEPEGAPLATSTETFRIPYRPSTTTSCPVTPEGKGFGANCDVGGLLTAVRFKHFSPEAVLPDKAIILITAPSRTEWEEHPVNVGLETSYKAFEAGNFVEEPPADGGLPEIGSDPIPNEAYVGGKVEAGWANFLPVFQVTARR